MPPRRHALSDHQWGRVADLFERPRRPGGQWKDHRLGRAHARPLDGVLWKTVYGRFARWRGDGTLDRVAAHLQRDLDRDGLIEWSAFCVDSATVRASRVAAGARKRGAPPSGRLALVSRRIMRWGGRAAVLRPRGTS